MFIHNMLKKFKYKNANVRQVIKKLQYIIMSLGSFREVH